MSNLKIVISGGGTGGHIYPAIAIAKKILEKNKDSKILGIINFVCFWNFKYSGFPSLS